jgi:D-alanyl-D-alanine carboxypeptidase
VLGASSGKMRAVRAAQLLDRGFANNGLSWLRPSLGSVDNLMPIDATPPNLRDEMCGGKRKRPASDEDPETVASSGESAGTSGGQSLATFFAAGLQPPVPKPSELLAQAAAPSEPIPVYTGPTRTGAALIAAVAADSDRDAAKPRGKGRKTHVAARKPDAGAEPKSDARSETKSETKSDAGQAAKPVVAVRHATVKPDAGAAKPAPARPAPAKPAVAKPAAKPAAAATADQAAAPKPAKPKAAAKPKNEAKPAG